MKRTLSVPRTEDTILITTYFESGGFKQSSILLVECGQYPVFPVSQFGPDLRLGLVNINDLQQPTLEM